MAAAPSDQKVIVVDFGAQYGQLIARRVRDLHVYSEIVPCDTSAAEMRKVAPAAIILSGGPASVYAEDAPSIDPGIFELGIPVLGFCYGQQIMAVTLGGSVGHTEKGEYGAASLTRCDEGASKLYGATPVEQTVWMSHRDAVAQAPEGFTVTASTDTCPVASMECAERRLYATQFHPEVRHTPHGDELLRNFLFDICDLDPSWTMDSIIEDSVAAIREQVGANRVILGLSGGVDSSVVAALCARAIGKQLTCVFVNHGLLRKNEPEEVEEVFTKQFDVDFVHVHAEDRYAALLADVVEPEQKRRIIGSQFWKEFFSVAQDLDGVKFLAQGTIYPDIIESGARKTGGKASTIKSHHNLIPFPEGVHFDLIEPLDHFFKDEVRALGTALGLPDHIVHRQPFPGPGLAIRIIGTVTREKLEILKNADAIVREELDAYNARIFEETGDRNSERSVWQYFAVLPDIKSVGVMGDERTYAYPIILRAVESSDAMTADWAKLPYEVLERVSGRIVAEVPGVNRVAYDITSKPPATIEWE
ncbi:glutamine-hydrolyzing GMP synthase [Gordonibacter massiliensis (ex Traore et al. 2017)]|uniref:GMP synthase [glutamine-hydrolyzing] n=1 Tax=Gordonibacter massiliensis (ex Traore et al. 2017) TaxID=1841863 RepID=A0A842JFH7_9ACTN|nr:glutamine-hydrolyzing GMP synthase [Gordonibacter massiliensis (ex Traore et al. 2017)]MBC2889706.1 glutamine-hydrolyzing GMP synthase [Gordonibacter massiliensis (ex Traore et al. 2017)]